MKLRPGCCTLVNLLKILKAKNFKYISIGKSCSLNAGEIDNQSYETDKEQNKTILVSHLYQSDVITSVIKVYNLSKTSSK